jgi:dual specificity MAP kinase phosphatase
MATLVEHASALHSRTSTPPPHLTLNTSTRGTPAAIPNKHLPICSPGRGPVSGLTTPPASPPSKSASLSVSSSILYPPESFAKLSESPPIYSIGASTLVDAIEHHATQPLPDPKHVFPWLHGLHADNAIQLSFFVARKKSLRKVPQCLRGVTIVKAGGDLCKAKLKGAISPEELFGPEPKKRSLCEAAFLEIDPNEGFSVRNFQIQACKMATVSDIVVYNDGSTKPGEVLFLAGRIAAAQIAWRGKLRGLGWESEVFNTFVVSGMYMIQLGGLSHDCC